jgi:hypothetical protein
LNPRVAIFAFYSPIGILQYTERFVKSWL